MTAGTRAKRSTGPQKICTIVSRDVKIPDDWNKFLEMDENKANLTQFLSNELERNVHQYGQEIVISGGFDDPEKVASPAGYVFPHFQTTHEEAGSAHILSTTLMRRKYQVQLLCVWQFVCKLYDLKSTSDSIHEVRCSLFRKVKANVNTLPPTKDALTLHLMRAHYQTKVWKQALVTHPSFPHQLVVVGT